MINKTFKHEKKTSALTINVPHRDSMRFHGVGIISLYLECLYTDIDYSEKTRIKWTVAYTKTYFSAKELQFKIMLTLFLHIQWHTYTFFKCAWRSMLLRFPALCWLFFSRRFTTMHFIECRYMYIIVSEYFHNFRVFSFVWYV